MEFRDTLSRLSRLSALLAHAASRGAGAFRRLVVLSARLFSTLLSRRRALRAPRLFVSLFEYLFKYLADVAVVQVPRALVAGGLSLFFLLPFYPCFYLGFYSWDRRSKPPTLLPSTRRRGDRLEGKAMLQGVCDWGGQRIVRPYPFWQPAAASSSWLEHCHSFVWLDDVHAYAIAVADTEKKLQAVRFVAERIGDWLVSYQRWSWEAWRPSRVRKRLLQWLQHYDWYAPALSSLQRATLHRALYAHYRHLCRAARLSSRFEVERLMALLACTTASLCLRDARVRRLACEDKLCRCLEEQVPRGEGFWHGRKACVQLAVMEELLQARRLYEHLQLLPPEGLTAALDRMVPALMMLRCSDGGLATFRGSREGSATALARVLAAAQVRARAPLSAPRAGLERMVAEKALVLVDTSSSRRARRGEERAYASASAFEFGYERDRIVVSCALEAAENAIAPLRAPLRAARSSAAHSMLVLAERNVLSRNSLVARALHEGQTRLIVSHDGYKKSLGIVVSRELHLSRLGTRLWGWERLSVPARTPSWPLLGLPFALRFHLHPKVRVFLLRNGREAILKPENRLGFRFRVEGDVRLVIAESLYGGEGKLVPSKQLLLSGRIMHSPQNQHSGENLLLAWRLQHETDEEA